MFSATWLMKTLTLTQMTISIFLLKLCSLLHIGDRHRIFLSENISIFLLKLCSLLLEKVEILIPDHAEFQSSCWSYVLCYTYNRFPDISRFLIFQSSCWSYVLCYGKNQGFRNPSMEVISIFLLKLCSLLLWTISIAASKIW